MIEHLFELVNPSDRSANRGPDRKSRPRDDSNGGEDQDRIGETERSHPASTTHMKRATSNLVAATLRTGLMVGLALVLILVLVPAAIAAQAAGLR